MPPAVRTASSRKRSNVPPNPTPDLRVLLRGLEAFGDTGYDRVIEQIIGTLRLFPRP